MTFGLSLLVLLIMTEGSALCAAGVNSIKVIIWLKETNKLRVSCQLKPLSIRALHGTSPNSVSLKTLTSLCKSPGQQLRETVHTLLLQRTSSFQSN